MIAHACRSKDTTLACKSRLCFGRVRSMLYLADCTGFEGGLSLQMGLDDPHFGDLLAVVFDPTSARRSVFVYNLSRVSGQENSYRDH